nr:O-antigen ligase family protein [Hanstruepera marina]
MEKKYTVIIPFLVLGITYFSISGFNYTGITEEYIKDVIRYFVFIIGAISLAKSTDRKTLLILFIIGGASVLINALVFPNSYGRYSGLYLNPNRAGLVCLIGFVLTYTIDKTYLRLLFQFVLTIAGILTLSRYFILVLVIINVVSVFVNKKNSAGLLAGAVALIIIIGTSSLQLNTDRFRALKSIFSGNTDVKTITKESRDETWALYHDILVNNPLIGVGYREMQGKKSHKVSIKSGVHNTYLMVLGESGIVPFLIIIVFYLSMLVKSRRFLATHQELAYMAFTLTTFLLVSHNYFDNYIVLFLSIWLYSSLTISDENPINQNNIIA